MRVTPKSLFLVLVASGFPFAVTLGWVLGDTTPIPPPAVRTPDGIGGIGTAPERDEPVKPVEYPEPTFTPRPAWSTAPADARPRTADPTASPSSAVPSEPAPSTVPSESTPPRTPASPSADSSGVEVGRRFRDS